MHRQSSNSNFYNGAFRHGIDPKKRVTIPASWRMEEGGVLYIRVDSDATHLVVMGIEEFRDLLTSITNDHSLNEAEQNDLTRYFSSTTRECSVDKQGRMVLPADMCAEIAIEDEAMLVGNIRRFEIWNRQRWEEKQALRTLNNKDYFRRKGL